MIVDIPEIDWIITRQDLLEVEEMLRRLPPPGATHTEIELPRGTFSVWEGLGSALTALAIVAAVAALIQIIANYESPRQRRRRKTQLCVLKCFDILKGAKEDIDAGYFANRALESNDEERRTRRDFKSRA